MFEKMMKVNKMMDEVMKVVDEKFAYMKKHKDVFDGLNEINDRGLALTKAVEEMGVDDEGCTCGHCDCEDDLSKLDKIEIEVDMRKVNDVADIAIEVDKIMGVVVKETGMKVNSEEYNDMKRDIRNDMFMRMLSK